MRIKIGDEVMFMTSELHMPNGGVCHSGVITKIFVDDEDYSHAVEIEYGKKFLFFRWKHRRVFLSGDVVGVISQRQKEIDDLEKMFQL